MDELEKRDLILALAGAIIGITGWYLIVSSLGWKVGIGLFLIFWGHNIDLRFRFKLKGED